MITFDPKNAKTGIKVDSKFKALFLKVVWTKFNLSDRNFLSSLKNYYDVNGFISNAQYKCLSSKYDFHIEKYTEFQKDK